MRTKNNIDSNMLLIYYVPVVYRTAGAIVLTGILKREMGRASVGWRSLFLAVGHAFLVSAILAGPASADQYDVFNVVLGSSLTYDANVFRLPDKPQLVGGRRVVSDKIGVFYAGLRIDKPYAQQRLQFGVTETAYRYGNRPSLNFNALDYRGAWLWHLGPRLSGTLSADRKKSSVSYDNFRGSQTNVRTTDNHSFNLDGWVFGGWHLLLGISRNEQKNSVPFLAEQDVRTTKSEAGVNYVSGSGKSITVTRRSTRGNYLNRGTDLATVFDKDFREQESELNASWIVSGNSTLNGHLSRTERRHERFSQRDFSGRTGEFGYAWTPTGKLRVNFSAKRNIAPFLGAGSSYSVSDTLSLAPAWQVGARTEVHMSFSRTEQDFPGSVDPSLGPARSDTLNSLQLGLSWSPLRNASISASLQRDRRSSNDAAFEFDGTIASFSASLTF